MKGKPNPSRTAADETRFALIAGGDGPELRAVTAAADTAEPSVDIRITTWNTVDDRGSFFVPGSFKKSLKERAAEAPVLYAHDFWGSVPIGITDEKASGEDADGVVIRGLFNGTALSNDVYQHLTFAADHGKRGLGASFGFTAIRSRSGDPKKDKNLDMSVAPDWASLMPITDLRAIEELRYYEASLLIFGSNEKAGPIAVRSRAWLHDLAMLERAIDAGDITDDVRTELGAVASLLTRKAAGADQSNDDHATDDATARREREFRYAMLNLPDDLKGDLATP